jgi:hypothetical protein
MAEQGEEVLVLKHFRGKEKVFRIFLGVRDMAFGFYSHFALLVFVWYVGLPVKEERFDTDINQLLHIISPSV